MRETAVVGRIDELSVIDAFLEALTTAPSVLVFEGEPGIGKTTLWNAAVERARKRGIRTLVSRPASSETPLTFAGLGDVLDGVGDDVFDLLPPPQRHALDVALLRSDSDGTGPEQRIVSAAFLGTLRALADETPVLVAVDDVQWLDTASRHVLEFALRRLEDERVGVLGAIRLGTSPGRSFPESDVQRIRLEPLNLAALHEILKAELGETFARPTLVRIEAASSGNPFFAVELARALAERGEPVHGSSPLPVPSDLTEIITGRLQRLPTRARRALLAASALSVATLDRLDRDAIARAEAADIVTIDNTGVVRFAHPLLAASVYASAKPAERRNVHRELAAQVSSSEERARHLALAAEGRDEAVANALAEAARNARDRGAPDAAIELLELSCDLTPPDELAVGFERKLDLGRYLSEAGDPQRASATLRDVADDAPSGATRARALLLLAYMSETAEAGEVATALCEQALQAAKDDIPLQVEILAATSRMSDYDIERKTTYARRALDLASDDVGPQLRSYALLASAEAAFFGGRGIAFEEIHRAALLEVEAAGATSRAPGRSLHRVHHYSDIRPSARLLGILRIYADELAEARAEFEIERSVASDHGDEVQLARTLIRLGIIELRAGNPAGARDHLDDAATVLERTHQEALKRWMLATRSLLETHCGQVDEARSAGEKALTLSVAAGSIWGIAECHAALGFLDLSVGAHESAVMHLDLTESLEERIAPNEPRLLRSRADHIEALVATGQLDRAERVLATIRPSGSRWAKAIAARCRALVCSAHGDLDGATQAIGEALIAHDQLPLPFERARTLLVQGQILRRQRERLRAKDALDESFALFDALRAPLWAARAQGESRRLGLRRGSPDTLTPSEETIASLAGSGLTNREIAERVFVSPKTVEASLARAYRKLGIRSRAELGAVMASRESEAGT